MRSPPPPRIFGMFNLAGILEVIYGAQQVAGKILSAKDLTRTLTFEHPGNTV